MKRIVKLATAMTIALTLNACSDSSETSRSGRGGSPVARPAPPAPVSAPPPDDGPRFRRPRAPSWSKTSWTQLRCVEGRHRFHSG